MEKNILGNLEPKAVFRFFEELTRLPHESGNTAAASDWAEGFARERGLKCRRDQMGNVVIWKGASPGYEDHPAVMLQGHLDMVCVKEPGVEHDFTKDSLDLFVDGDWIGARGTSLGGDDGVAVAMAMAVLDDDSIPHPPIEAVFTVDEEVGLLGAAGLDASDLASRILINLDSEVEGILTVGCAGGARCDLEARLSMEEASGMLCGIALTGLSGGHSGTMIHLGLANANKLLGDLLAHIGPCRLVSLYGGEQDNAIPNSARAAVLVDPGQEDAARAAAEAWLKTQSWPKDPHLALSWTAGQGTARALSQADTEKAIQLIQEVPNGVQAMNPDLPGQVQTSLNLGRLRLDEGALALTFSLRSSVGEEKERLAGKLQSLCAQYGADFSRRGDYPGWAYRRDSRLRDTMVRVFRERYGKEPVVETIHAGLECGLLAEKLPGLDAVSTGPNILEIHSARERLSIASVQRTWAYLLEVLAAL